MSMRYKGGVISATPPTTSSSSAVGIWTLEEALQAKAAGTWPLLTVLVDYLVVAGGAGFGGSVTVAGTLRVGSNTFTRTFSSGDVTLDNGSAVDTPGITYYWGNLTNYGTDVYSDGVGSTRYRVVYNLNENGGREVFTIDTNGNVRLYNNNGTNYFGFKFTGVATTTYTLPASTPAGTAVSVLQSDQAGNMSWVAMAAGSASGTVNSGNANFAA